MCTSCGCAPPPPTSPSPLLQKRLSSRLLQEKRMHAAAQRRRADQQPARVAVPHGAARSPWPGSVRPFSPADDNALSAAFVRERPRQCEAFWGEYAAHEGLILFLGDRYPSCPW